MAALSNIITLYVNLQLYFEAYDSITSAKYLDVCDRLLFFWKSYSEFYVIPYTLVIHRAWSLANTCHSPCMVTCQHLSFTVHRHLQQ
jgi:hypothetical protein